MEADAREVRPYTVLRFYGFTVLPLMEGVRLLTEGRIFRTHVDWGKAYNITGIPRFILIGKDGKVIYSKAPRPSSDEIRAVLNDALK